MKDDGFISISISRPLLSASTPDDIISMLNRLYEPIKGPVRINMLLRHGNQIGCYFVEQGVPYHHYCPAEQLTLALDGPIVIANGHPHAQPVASCGHEQATSYCQLPLTTARGHLGSVEFISDLEDHFCPAILARLNQFALIIAIAVENVLDKSHALEQANSLRLERDSCKILVDVTNALLKQTQICDLPTALFAVLQESLSLTSLCLVEYHTLHRRWRSYLINAQHSERPEVFDDFCLEKHCLKKISLLNEQVVMPIGRFSPCDHPCVFIAHIQPASESSFRVLPLRYRGQLLGGLTLAFRPDAKPETIEISLLEQIAARTAMAMDNALAHQEILHASNPVETNLTLDEPHADAGIPSIIHQSSVMAEVIEKIRMVADSDCSVLILGETGTGKELVAKAIHRLSHRTPREMVSINCAAIPTSLIESDLFGHEKGAFTGALSQRIGRFERAHKSTLFLDEVGDMPLELQPKLLRVLQEHQLERIGSSSPIAVDVRLIAATNCDLLSMIQEKRFRSDLYYRLNVFPIMLPPLRERREDIPLLVNYFVKKIAKRMQRDITAIPSGTMKALMAQPWPGNIRELENVIERAVIMTHGHVLNLHADTLQSPITTREISMVGKAHTEALPDTETQQILETLRACNGIVAGDRGAAKRLGMKRTTLLSRMKRLGISSKDFH